MAWIESHQTLREHPKTYLLCGFLSIKKAQVIGHLHLLWWWCVDYAPEGQIKHNDQQIARAAEWSGDSKQFVDALVAAGFLDRSNGVLTVHDWEKFRLHYDLMLQRREKQLEQTRKRVEKYRKKSEKTRNVTKSLQNKNTDDGDIKNVTLHVTQCNAPTKPNQPNQTKPNALAGSPPAHTAKDCLKYFGDVYKKHRGETYVANFGKDGAIFKELLKLLPSEEICSRIDLFFRSEDEFIRKAGYTVGVFKSQVNKLSQGVDNVPSWVQR